MDIAQMRVFLAVADELHFRRAAERLRMSQSSVSVAVKRLEHEVGGPLFKRTTRNVSLTPAGEALRAGISAIVVDLDTVITDARQLAAGHRRRVRIGYVGGGIYELTEPFLRLASDRHPDYDIDLIEVSYERMHTGVPDGGLDAVLFRLPLTHPGMTSGPVILRDRRVILMRETHELAERDSLSWDDVARFPLVRYPETLPHTWSDFHSPRVTPSGARIPNGPVAATVREAISAVARTDALTSLTQRATEYYRSPGTVARALATHPIDTVFAWRRRDSRPILVELSDDLRELSE